MYYFTNVGTYVDMENYQEKINISDNRTKTLPTNTQKEKSQRPLRIDERHREKIASIT